MYVLMFGRSYGAAITTLSTDGSVDIPPAPIFVHKTAMFMHACQAAADFATGRKTDACLVAVAFMVMHLQPQPFESWAFADEVCRAGIGMPACQ